MRLPTESPCLLAASLAAIGVFFVAGAQALEPDKVFEKASPSVVTVVAMRDPTSKEFQSGSGIVIDPDTVITNCHVLQGGKVVVVKIGKRILPAKLQFPDVERDLCQLSVADLQAPAIQFSSTSTLRVGQRVFAIGNPRQLELTMSDGIISSLRDSKDGAPIVQTTAPISPGSSGGGLFDTEGRLIGITTFQRRDSQNLNFALPSEWIRDVPARGKDSLAKYEANKASGAYSAPAPAPIVSPRPAIAAISPAPRAAESPEWTERIALLEKARGDLTLSKAVAILLDITSAEDMNLLRSHERFVRRQSWHNGYAMGLDQQGMLVWGGGYRLRNVGEVEQTARGQCVAARRENPCTLVVLDGNFREDAFVEMARKFGNLDVAASRQVFLASLRTSPTETRVGSSGGGSCAGQDCFSYGYSSYRERD